MYHMYSLWTIVGSLGVLYFRIRLIRYALKDIKGPTTYTLHTLMRIA